MCGCCSGVGVLFLSRGGRFGFGCGLGAYEASEMLDREVLAAAVVRCQ